jgi:hypothetical protein
VCWKIWLSRNKAIFKNKFLHPYFVVAHDLGQMVEYLTLKGLEWKEIEKLEPKEELWMDKLNIKVTLSTKISQRSFWKLRVSPQEFGK